MGFLFLCCIVIILEPLAVFPPLFLQLRDVCYVTSLYSDSLVETVCSSQYTVCSNAGDDPASGHLREAVHVLFLLGENSGSDVPRRKSQLVIDGKEVSNNKYRNKYVVIFPMIKAKHARVFPLHSLFAYFLIKITLLFSELIGIYSSSHKENSGDDPSFCLQRKEG